MIIRSDKSPSEINPFKGAHSPSENPPQIDRAQRRFRWIMQDLLPAAFLGENYLYLFCRRLSLVSISAHRPCQPCLVGHASAQFTQKSNPFLPPVHKSFASMGYANIPRLLWKSTDFRKKILRTKCFLYPPPRILFSTLFDLNWG